MNNKGFTLIELVGIVLILAAILLISFPSLLNISASDEEKKFDSMVDNLCLAGEAYIHANSDDFSELSIIGSVINISVEELIAYGNIDRNTKNPKTNDNILDDTLTYTVNSDYSLECEYVDN